jgi:hypothetical protein
MRRALNILANILVISGAFLILWILPFMIVPDELLVIALFGGDRSGAAAIGMLWGLLSAPLGLGLIIAGGLIKAGLAGFK